MKHTAGPWTVGNPEGRLHYIMVGGHTVIATLPDYQGSSSAYVISDREEREANARLISAAPELLAALADVDLRCAQARLASGIGKKKDRTDFLLGELERIAKHARAAIEKAKGDGPKI